MVNQSWEFYTDNKKITLHISCGFDASTQYFMTHSIIGSTSELSHRRVLPGCITHGVIAVAARRPPSIIGALPKQSIVPGGAPRATSILTSGQSIARTPHDNYVLSRAGYLGLHNNHIYSTVQYKVITGTEVVDPTVVTVGATGVSRVFNS